jgi:NADH:ubiquinone reductase (H+-translocating)
MNTPKHIVIIGAGYAGLMCALRASRQPNAKITLINAHTHFIERVRLHQAASGQTLKSYPIESLIRGRNIQFIQGKVTHITETSVWLGQQEIPFDKLVYALGSLPDTTAVPGIAEHAYTLHPSDTASLLTSLKAGGRVLVIGGGLTGIESATEIAEMFPQNQVTLITQGKVGQGLSNKGRAYLYDTFKELNITLHEHVSVNALSAGCADTSMGAIGFETCIWAGSFTVPSLAKEVGIQTNERGQIIVDEYLQSVSHPTIFATGDSAYVPNIRMSCATAMPLGTHTGDNLVHWLRHETLEPFSFSYPGQCISLGRKRGMIQFTNKDDSPQERIITGKFGAMIKEFVVRYTVASLHLERRIPGNG